MHTHTMPRDARHLRSYQELDSYLQDFVRGVYPFVWLAGRPGLAKTESVRSAVRGQRVYYRKGGQLTPLQLYIDLFRCRGQPVILDDVEHLLLTRLGAKLISALGDTSPAKLLSYGTTSRLLGDVPRLFYTTSPLCVIANWFTTDEAVLSRAVKLVFEPTSIEVHRYVAGWFWDAEVHDWFGRHLHALRPLQARWYVVAAMDKQAGRDWRRIILNAHAHDRASCVVQDLEADAAFPTREAKANRFVDVMGDAKGASRATYFRLRRRLEEQQRLAAEVVAPIPLRRSKPPSVPSLMELEAMEALPEAQPGEEAGPLDIPMREAFQEPVRGEAPPPAPPRRPVLDDSLPWEQRQRREDDEE